jgi:hypothetical protein
MRLPFFQILGKKSSEIYISAVQKKTKSAIKVTLIFWSGCTSHRHRIGHMATFQLYWCGGGRPKVPFRALFQARKDTWIEPPTFRKLAG